HDPHAPQDPHAPSGPYGAGAPGTAHAAGDLPGDGGPRETGAPAAPGTPHRSGTSYRVGTLNEAAARDGAAPLVPGEAREELTRRLHESVTGFVDSPHQSVKEAAAVLDAATDRLTAALTDHRRTLRADWEGGGDEHEPDTERLRVTLQAYREMADRLLRL
ncbi:hypothetical protein, partial [Streptomyces sp. WAC05374]|uniref:hypothetical protein n=1 Tax=Streptomyces sp. WAC05374 TaxID=2487420 RepID=UPI00163CC2CA